MQELAAIGKLSQNSAAAQSIDAAAKPFSFLQFSLQMLIIELQEDISLQIYKTAFPEEFSGKGVSEKFDH